MKYNTLNSRDDKSMKWYNILYTIILSHYYTLLQHLTLLVISKHYYVTILELVPHIQAITRNNDFIGGRQPTRKHHKSPKQAISELKNCGHRLSQHHGQPQIHSGQP